MSGPEDIPRSVRVIPREMQHLSYYVGLSKQEHIMAQRSGSQVQVPWHPAMSDCELGQHLRFAIQDAYGAMVDHLRREAYVADADADLWPEINVRLDIKSWPAVPGVTTLDPGEQETTTRTGELGGRPHA